MSYLVKTVDKSTQESEINGTYLEFEEALEGFNDVDTPFGCVTYIVEADRTWTKDGEVWDERDIIEEKVGLNYD